MDANTYYLNKYLDSQERAERAYESFEQDISQLLETISRCATDILSIARDYEFCGKEYDFSEDALESIFENLR